MANGIGRVGWRSYVSPISALWNNLFGVWNADGTNTISVKHAWNANGDAIDSKSGANGTIATPSGSSWVPSTMTYDSGKLGSSAFTFNGSNFIALPNNTFKFTDDYSISFWVYIPSSVTSDPRYNSLGVPLISSFDNTNAYTVYAGWSVSWYNNLLYFSSGGDIYGNNYSQRNTPMTLLDQWVHVCVTRKYSTRSRIYINGSLVADNAISQNPVYKTNNISYIGARYYSSSLPFYHPTIAGVKIDAIQTWDGAELDEAAVTELYNSGNGQEYPFTISNALIATPKDSYGTNHGTLMNGAKFTTGKIGNAFLFDGVNDYIQLPNNSLNFTGDFSISAWLYFPTDIQLIGSDKGYILSNWTAISWTSNLAGWYFTTGGNQIGFTTFNGTSTSVILETGSGVPALDRSGWRHIVFTRTGTTYKLWLDGGQYTATSTTMLTPKYEGTIIPKIGRLGDSTMGGWDSFTSAKIKIDAVSVWEKSLTEAEITELYNSGTGKQYPN